MRLFESESEKNRKMLLLIDFDTEVLYTLNLNFF